MWAMDHTHSQALKTHVLHVTSIHKHIQNKLINSFKDCKERIYALLICKIKLVNAGKASRTCWQVGSL